MRPSLLLAAVPLLALGLGWGLAGGNDGDADAVTIEHDALASSASPMLSAAPGAGRRAAPVQDAPRLREPPAGAPPAPPGPGPRPRGEDGVGLGLRWLAAHQSPDGSWAPEADPRACLAHQRPDGFEPPTLGSGERGLAQHRVGVTSCALLAFLGAGYTHRGEHEFAGVVKRARAWLVAQQQHGYVRTTAHRTWAWDHALATWALMEGYGMTESAIWERPAVQALGALGRLRGPEAWRYGVARGLEDESLTLWAMLPLLSAKLIAEDRARREQPVAWSLDLEALDAGIAWLDRVTGTLGSPRDLPLPLRGDAELPGTSPDAFYALSLVVRMGAGQDLRADRFAPARAWLATRQPAWDPARGDADVLAWWAGTHAAFVCGGETWKAWDTALSSTLLPGHVLEGLTCDLKGSWAPGGDLGRLGGRTLATALACLALEIYYRYDRAIGAR